MVVLLLLAACHGHDPAPADDGPDGVCPAWAWFEDDDAPITMTAVSADDPNTLDLRTTAGDDGDVVVEVLIANGAGGERTTLDLACDGGALVFRECAYDFGTSGSAQPEQRDATLDARVPLRTADDAAWDVDVGVTGTRFPGPDGELVTTALDPDGRATGSSAEDGDAVAVNWALSAGGDDVCGQTWWWSDDGPVGVSDTPGATSPQYTR